MQETLLENEEQQETSHVAQSSRMISHNSSDEEHRELEGLPGHCRNISLIPRENHAPSLDLPCIPYSHLSINVTHFCRSTAADLSRMNLRHIRADVLQVSTDCTR